MARIVCRIERVVYRNDDNGFAVLEAKISGGDSGGRARVRAVGTMPDARAGIALTLTGEFGVNAKFGEQFAFDDYEEAEPTDAESTREFLESGIIKGIGPKTAALIVARFGEGTMDVIRDEPRKLLAISGIGEKKLRQIQDSYAEHRELAGVVLQFVKLGIGRAAAVKFYKLYGAGAPGVVRENPYRLVRDVRGIDFKTADAIAMRMGFGADSEHRVKSGALYVLRRAVLEGNTWLPAEELYGRVSGLLDVARESIEDALLALVLEGEAQSAFVDGQKGFFLSYYYRAEKSVANALSRLAGAPLKAISTDAARMMDAMEAEKGIVLSGEQRRAILGSLEDGVFVITGGPGTGKTTIIKAVADILAFCGFGLAIAAPTGRAAKRVTEQTGYEAKTIHRLLEYSAAPGMEEDMDEDRERMMFRRDAGNPLELDALIVDEASMIDVLLMDALTDAMPSGARLIIVGDADQLPPVGPGNVLKDILASERVGYAALHEVYRQAAQSLIVTNAHRINRGEAPCTNDKDGNFFFYKKDTEELCLNALLDLCEKRLPEYMGMGDARDGIQVITPVKNRLLGTVSLNAELQKRLNPPAPGKNEREHGARVFREGDKVMQMKNDYELSWLDKDTFESGEGVFNGDIGIVERIDEDEGTIHVLYDGARLAKYDGDGIDNIELAYAITVHKSQGSEYPVVVMPMMFVPPMLATRNLLYTAVTRARDLVVLVGSEGRMMAMVGNASGRDRYSALASFIRDAAAAADAF